LNSKPLEPLTFFLDRSLGREIIATALRQSGLRIEIHDDHFAADERDEIWLRDVGNRGWIVLTKDRRIRYRTIEREALLSSGVRAFVLTSGNVTGQEMAQLFVKSINRMKRFLAKNRGPFVAKITRGGAIELAVK
jgi:predicted nuclease of predicted toxin-antitoxin system